jgi:hypothetical protein
MQSMEGAAMFYRYCLLGPALAFCVSTGYAQIAATPVPTEVPPASAPSTGGPDSMTPHGPSAADGGTATPRTPFDSTPPLTPPTNERPSPVPPGPDTVSPHTGHRAHDPYIERRAAKRQARDEYQAQRRDNRRQYETDKAAADARARAARSSGGDGVPDAAAGTALHPSRDPYIQRRIDRQRARAEYEARKQAARQEYQARKRAADQRLRAERRAGHSTGN